MKTQLYRPLLRLLLCALLLCLFLCGCARESAAPDATSTPAPTPTPVPPTDQLRISEVMSSNDSYVVKGQVGDWVELYNADDHPVALEEYFLSHRTDRPQECALPALTLQPGEYALLCCGTDLSFNLSREGVELSLTHRGGGVADSLVVPPLETDQSYTVEFGIVDTPTPGEENSDVCRSVCPMDGLYISEVVTSNSRYAPLKEEYYDLIELCWAGSGSISLRDYCLSDKKKDLPGWTLPDITLQSGGYALILCTGDGKTGAPFALSAEGETLYLSTADGVVLDALSIPSLPENRSYGRYAGDNVYFTTPTPGKANQPGYATMTPSPQVSLASGFYEAPFTVTLSGEGEIRYTVDGSNPSSSGKLYAGEEIEITKTMSLRAVASDDKRIPSSIVTRNYMISPVSHELDVVMLSLSPRDFSSYMLSSGSVTECGANVALFVDGEEQFSQPCGISVFGSGSRLFDKKSYQISFRARYGAPSLHYKLFDNREQDSFGAFNLRSGSQDQFYCNMKDELLTGLWDELSDDILTFAYRPVNLYINGAYWGIYYIRERCSRETVAWHDRVDKDSVDILRNLSATAGSPAAVAWGKVTQYIYSHDLSDPECYAYVSELLDMDSAVDYYLAQMWSTNYDLNNARVYRSDADGGKWRFILYDLDVAFFRSYSNTVEILLNSHNGLLRCLLTAPEFKEKFTLRMGELLSGPLSDENVLQRIDDFAALLDEDMRRNCTRWKYDNDYAHYTFYLDRMKSTPGVGVSGWNEAMIRQYIAKVHPDEELIRRAFGEDWA